MEAEHNLTAQEKVFVFQVSAYLIDAIMEETSSGNYKPQPQEELLICK